MIMEIRNIIIDIQNGKNDNKNTVKINENKGSALSKKFGD